MSKALHITDNVYRQDYVWVKVESSEDFNEYMKTVVSNFNDFIDADEEGSSCDGETICLQIEGKDVIFFWFKKDDITAQVHELLHAVFASMRSRGVVLTEESEETFCYVLSFLTGEVNKELHKKRLTKKKLVL